jgi:hypothetical protein
MSYRRREPSQRQDLREARRRYREFRGYEPSSIRPARMARRIPDVLVELGTLRAVIYRSDRGRQGRVRTYIHFMESPTTLACDPSGRQIYILGGRYRVTPRGIVG